MRKLGPINYIGDGFKFLHEIETTQIYNIKLMYIHLLLKVKIFINTL